MGAVRQACVCFNGGWIVTLPFDVSPGQTTVLLNRRLSHEQDVAELHTPVGMQAEEDVERQLPTVTLSCGRTASFVVELAACCSLMSMPRQQQRPHVPLRNEALEASCPL